MRENLSMRTVAKKVWDKKLSRIAKLKNAKQAWGKFSEHPIGSSTRPEGSQKIAQKKTHFFGKNASLQRHLFWKIRAKKNLHNLYTASQ